MAINAGLKVTRLPPHSGMALEWENNPGRRMSNHGGAGDSFSYIAPTVKYSPASSQPGPGQVYNSTKAAAIGHQPYNAYDSLPGVSTPVMQDWAMLRHGPRGDAAPLILQSQQMMAMVLGLRGNQNG